MKHKKILAAFFVILALTIFYSCTNTDHDSHKSTDENIAVSSDGNKISYEVNGNGSQTILFVHGWSNSRSVWDEQVTHFSEKYKVVTLDLAGFGKSDNNRKMWTMQAFGEDVAAVIKKLGDDQIVLVGFSMGGPVVIETAKKIPGHIKGIVLVDILQNIEANYSKDAISIITANYMDGVIDPSIEKVKVLFETNAYVLSEKYIAMVKDAPKTGWSESLTNCFKWINDNCVESLKNINVPITAINSDQYPTNSEAFRKHIPSFKAKIIPGVKHVVFWEAPEKFNQLLDESIQEFM